jgi:hypothetical protein
MAGAVMMFQKVDVTQYFFNEEEIPNVNRKRNIKLKVGLYLLFSGFALQLIALFF